MNKQEPDKPLSGSCRNELFKKPMTPSKILSMQTLLTVVFAGSVFSLFVFFDLVSQGDGLSVRVPKENTSVSFLVNATEKRTGVGLPVHLRIPALGVNAPVVYVGLGLDDSMDMPKDPNDAAWFNLGPRPGENGSAVIAGHYGWKNDIPAIFDDLSRLKKGNEIYVEDDNGTTITFIVREIRNFTSNADAKDVFGQGDGKAHLNLITCEGVWNDTDKSYPKRLVVFADKE